MSGMRDGRDFIVFPLDCVSWAEARDYVALLSDKVGMFKVGLELFISEGPGILGRIREMSRAGIFLDLKLHDISETVRRAMTAVSRLGADLVTVHCGASQRMLEAAVEGSRGKTGVLGVTLLTDTGADAVKAAGFQKQYVDDPGLLVMKRAEAARAAGCAGVVCAGTEAAMIKSKFGNDFLVVTPGIRPAWHGNTGDDQQRITTPSQAVTAGADMIVTGRPIRDAVDPAAAAVKIAREIEAVQSSLSRPKA